MLNCLMLPFAPLKTVLKSLKLFFNYIKFLLHLVRVVIDLSKHYSPLRLFTFLAAHPFSMHAHCYVICNSVLCLSIVFTRCGWCCLRMFEHYA
jgi:hypothetical protein